MLPVFVILCELPAEGDRAHTADGRRGQTDNPGASSARSSRVRVYACVAVDRDLTDTPKEIYEVARTICQGCREGGERASAQSGPQRYDLCGMMITDTGLRGRGRSGCPPLIAESGGASRVSEHFGGTEIRVRVRSGVCAATCWTRKKLRFKRERQIKVRNCQEIEFPLARFLPSPVAPPCSLPPSPNETVALLFFLCLIAVVLSLSPPPPPHVCVSRTHIIRPDGHALST